MAHLVVYMQRTPAGLHPGSAAALCIARDIADERGATLLALAEGDAQQFDEAMVREASRHGADQIYFVGPGGLKATCERLAPRHVFCPWTPRAEEMLSQDGIGPVRPIWVTQPEVEHAALEPVVGVLAGLPPWRYENDEIEAEFSGNVAEGKLPGWLIQGAETSSAIVYVAPQDLDPAARHALESLGATPVGPDHANALSSGTLLWLDAGPNGLPEGLRDRGPASRVVVLAGPDATMHDSWRLADWVLPGPWTEVVRELQGQPWKTMLE